MSEYDDIRVLSNTGMWPDGKEPKWATKLGAKCEVPSAHIVVQLAGAMHEIERLRADCQRMWLYIAEQHCECWDEYCNKCPQECDRCKLLRVVKAKGEYGGNS